MVRADVFMSYNVLQTAPPNKVFDKDGHFLRSMGSSGDGPGEFQSPGSFSVSPDGAVAVFDYGKGGLVRFDASGGVGDERPFPYFPSPNLHRHFT